MAVYVLIPAAGAGTRMRGAPGGKRKQHLEIAGVPILQRTLDAVLALSGVDHVICIVPEDELADAGKRKTERLHFVAGGSSRMESVACGLRYLDAAFPYRNGDLIAIHDGVRPFVSDALWQRLLDAVAVTGAAIPALPLTDTIKARAAVVPPSAEPMQAEPRLAESQRDNRLAAHLDRGELLAVQTPQLFDRARYAQALSAQAPAAASAADSPDEPDSPNEPDAQVAAVASGATACAVTDDSALFPPDQVVYVPGDRRNIKITTPDDLIIAEAFVSHPSRD